MPEDPTPEPQGDGGSPQGTPPTPPDGQPESERIKGFTRKINELQATIATLNTNLSALQKKYDVDVTAHKDAASTASQQITQLQTQIEALNTSLSGLQQTKVDLERQLAGKAAKDKQRELLLKSEEVDLLPFFEGGNFPLDGVEDVDGVKAKAASFRNLITGIAKKQFQGAQDQTPPPLPNTTGMSYEQLGAWLNDPTNWDSPQLPAFQKAFIDLAPKETA